MVENNPTLRRGHQGDGWVTYLQQLINEAARQPVLEESDNFDDVTEQAVVNFQEYHSLKSDGIVGPKTWLALLNKDIRWDLAFTGPGEYDSDRNEMHFVFINAGSVVLPVGDYVANMNIPHEGGEITLPLDLKAADGSAHAKPDQIVYGVATYVRENVPAGTHKYTVEIPVDFGGAKSDGEITI